jgi:hypothetical protein
MKKYRFLNLIHKDIFFIFLTPCIAFLIDTHFAIISLKNPQSKFSISSSQQEKSDFLLYLLCFIIFFLINKQNYRKRKNIFSTH